jgi:23S rRNA pseudouridine2457 synthase
MLVALNKPCGVLSQFTRELPHHRTLADFSFPKGFYGIGRLDQDSEGLLLLSDDPAWTDRLLNPRRRHPREYWAQVEGVPDETALARLRAGVRLGDWSTLPCEATFLEPGLGDALPPRDPPIRHRANIPTTWIRLQLVEGKNRQVRRMTAAVGHPTLRLVRAAIGGLRLAELGLTPGQWARLTEDQEKLVLSTD